jgi:phospholipid transport system substrate-binding protein
MVFQKTDLGGTSPQTCPDPVVERFLAAGLPRGVSEALADPMVRGLMAADRVDPKGIENLLRRIAASLLRRDSQDISTQPTRDGKAAASTGRRTLARSFALAVAVVAGLSAAPRPAAAEDASITFIRTLGQEAESVIRAPVSLPAKADWFGQMVRQDFDLTGIGRFVLGPYWRVSSPAEQKQFCDDFADRLVRVYGGQLGQAGDGDFVVTGSRVESDGVIVSSRIIRPQGAAIAVDWRLGISNGVYKIEDIAVDGVSMALTQRAEIAAMIAREGGQVDVLLATMGS